MRQIKTMLPLVGLWGLSGCFYANLFKSDHDSGLYDTGYRSSPWSGGYEEYEESGDYGDFYLTLTLIWTDADGMAPQDSDGDGVYDLGCTSDTLELVIEDPLYVDDWDFGMVDAAADGWAGEDCLNGTAGYALCHPIHLRHQLVEVCTPDEVVEGATTLFDHGMDPLLTYMIDDRGDCFVVGNDVPYYDAMGCTLLQ